MRAVSGACGQYERFAHHFAYVWALELVEADISEHVVKARMERQARL
jgi:hypothetical protein